MRDYTGPDGRGPANIEIHGVCQRADGYDGHDSGMRKGRCAPMLDLTHSFDVASRWWLLPYVASVVNGTAKALLSGLIDRMGSAEAGQRLTFTEAVAWLDRAEL